MSEFCEDLPFTYMYFLYQSHGSGLQIPKHWVYKVSWTVLL